MSFYWNRSPVDNIEFLCAESWQSATPLHGFVGVGLDFSELQRERSAQRFLNAFNLISLLLPRQVHGNAIWDLRGKEVAPGLIRGPEADVTILERGRSKIALGILTADCLPILIRDEDQVAIVHAGWRGLAAGVIEAALAQFSLCSHMEALIGPAAGPDSYEVGPEVLEALGPRAKCRSSKVPGKALLDLPATARAVIEGHGAHTIHVACAGICSITSPKFHSFRRDGARAGRNLGFITSA